VVPGTKHVRHTLRDQRSTHRQPTTERFGERHDVGCDAVRLVRPQVPGAAKTALHFVKDQERAGAVTQRSQPAEESRIGGMDAAFSLHRLDDDRACAAAYQSLGGGEVIESRELRTRHERAVGILIVGSRCEREGAHGPTMKGSGKGHELDSLAAARVLGALASELDRCLHCFSARVAEVDLVRKGRLHEHPREADLRLAVVQVGDVHQPLHLL